MAKYPYKKRIIRILELLSSGRKVSVKLLDREFEGSVSLRTLQRDLQEISAAYAERIPPLTERHKAGQ
jgi:predicted DNA-binding transcriptional regulator YafY